MLVEAVSRRAEALLATAVHFHHEFPVGELAQLWPRERPVVCRAVLVSRPSRRAELGENQRTSPARCLVAESPQGPEGKPCPEPVGAVQKCRAKAARVLVVEIPAAWVAAIC